MEGAEAPLVPEYNKPDAPGIWMNFDNTVSLYHVVDPADDFDKAAQDLFALLRDAQKRFPDWPRVLYLDVNGHRDSLGRFEPDFVELQQDLVLAPAPLEHVVDVHNSSLFVSDAY